MSIASFAVSYVPCVVGYLVLRWLYKKRHSSINDTRNKFLYGVAYNLWIAIAGCVVMHACWPLAKSDGRYVLGIALGAIMTIVSGIEAASDWSVHRMLRSEKPSREVES